MSPFVRDLVYLLAAGMLILGLRRLSSPKTAASGNRLAALAMLLAVVVTVLDRAILDYTWILAGLIVGSAVGVAAARLVQMTAMPQMVGLLNGLGGAASALVATAEFLRGGGVEDAGARLTLALGTLIGTFTFTGSLVAFGKLQGWIAGRPTTWPLQRTGNALLFAAAVLAVAGFAVEPAGWIFAILTAVALVLGVVAVLPIGGGDMPVVISLLNSYSGIAASMAGFVLQHKLLIVAGALVGASGLILTRLMCVAMNRSLANVLFSAFGKVQAGTTAGEADQRTVRSGTAQDAAILMANASLVVVVPGYGLAVARAQHTLRELGDLLAERGVEVKYAIHPVAGRMPGHMNVLLAEADVPYDRLFELEAVNPDLGRAEVALVVGANDVVNPAARHDRQSPIYGMPILDVDKAGTALVLKRSMRPGFAGIQNELFYLDRTMMLFGDAQDTLSAIVAEVKQL